MEKSADAGCVRPNPMSAVRIQTAAILMNLDMTAPSKTNLRTDAPEAVFAVSHTSSAGAARVGERSAKHTRTMRNASGGS
ncbi:hypothetical protein GCM10011588_09270 [Nocardia jinanensis]|uniref:Uncharacterized protein n=1 Tax=Nocardia jinanensis TaxID=382504 RepID=A0A917RA20_9NOCA|nr:hypothetical protein GCM10011588_09270 [Nocardia jinanensis]